MKIILYIVAAVRALLVFGGMAIYMLTYGLSCIIIPHSRARALNLRKHYLKFWCIPILNIKVIVTGQPIDGPALYVCNHRSFADPIVLCRYLKAFIIAKAEVMNYPIINKGAELTGVIWVNRNDQNSRNDTRNTMIAVIHDGFNILVYPEGTVGKERGTLPFKKGTFMEAAANGIQVVPVAMEFKSPRDLWILEKFLPQYFYQFSKWKTEVKLTFGPNISDENGEVLHSKSHQWINEELSRMQNGWSNMFVTGS